MRELIAIVVLLVLATAAYAAETITYKYDARGRLIQASHAGTVNNNVVSNYSYDKADNRNVVIVNGVSP
jgi:YD repeat-containing protein